MSMLPADYDGRLAKMLQESIAERLTVIADEEIKLAQEKVKTRILGEVDSIALRLLSEYDVMRHGQNLVITVRKGM